MRFSAVVFDFDGCLVDSAEAKYRGFFEVFPSGNAHRRVVSDVLGADPDGSRYKVIPRIAEKMRRAGLSLDDCLSDEERIVMYGRKTMEAVATCPALPDAEELLRRAREFASVYISSNTPEATLKQLVSRRGWLPLLNGVYGYPRSKKDTLREIVAEGGGDSKRVLVVGDGISDEEAARDAGCSFVRVNVHSGLAPVSAALEINNVQK